MLELIVEFVKRNKPVVIIIVIILIITVPIIINTAYLSGADNSKFNTYFSASDLLSYWGALLVFLGTITLSALALIQNERLNKTNALLSKLKVEEMLPTIIIAAFIESEQPSSRLPDTTKSVLKGSKRSSSFSSPQDLIDFENKQAELFDKLSRLQLNGITEEVLSKSSELNVELFELSKSVPVKTVEEFTEIFWFINSTFDSNAANILAPETMYTATYKFLFKNISKARITKINVNSIRLEFGFDNFTFKPLENHDFVELLLNPESEWNFYINLILDKSDKSTTALIKTSPLLFRIDLSLTTIGGLEQNEIINIESWMNTVNCSYELPQHL